MSADPWSRPTLDDLKRVLESIGKTDGDHERAAERLDFWFQLKWSQIAAAPSLL